MTLTNWLANRWIQTHQIDAAEVDALLALVDQDLADCAITALSLDRQLGIAYNACLQMALLALAAEGYRPGRDRHHELAIESLGHTLGLDLGTVQTLQAIRRKRNVGQYERPGAASQTEAETARRLAVNLHARLMVWLRDRHPALLP